MKPAPRWRHGLAWAVLPVLLLLFAWPWQRALLPRGDAPTDAAQVARGRRLVEHFQCGACHRIDGVGQARGTLGPPLTGLAQRSYIAGRLPNHGDMLARWIVDPPALVPGTPMPVLGVREDQAHDIAAYLRTLP
jgi:cytochrome c